VVVPVLERSELLDASALVPVSPSRSGATHDRATDASAIGE
jgi:hypothetical protein